MWIDCYYGVCCEGGVEIPFAETRACRFCKCLFFPRSGPHPPLLPPLPQSQTLTDPRSISIRRSERLSNKERVQRTSTSDNEVEGSSEGGVPRASPSDNEVEGSSEGGVPSASPSDDMNVDIVRFPQTSNLDEGSHVLVDSKGKLYRATIRKLRVKSGKQEFLIHYDGNKKSTVRWIPVDRIKSTDVARDEDIYDQECNDDHDNKDNSSTPMPSDSSLSPPPAPSSSLSSSSFLSTQPLFEEDNDNGGGSEFLLEGRVYSTYNKMVISKRERNHKVLEKIVCDISSFAALDHSVDGSDASPASTEEGDSIGNKVGPCSDDAMVAPSIPPVRQSALFPIFCRSPNRAVRSARGGSVASLRTSDEPTDFEPSSRDNIFEHSSDDESTDDVFLSPHMNKSRAKTTIVTKTTKTTRATKTTMTKTTKTKKAVTRRMSPSMTPTTTAMPRWPQSSALKIS